MTGRRFPGEGQEREPQAPTFGSVLRRHAAGPGAETDAIRYGDEAISWRELDRRSGELAAVLRDGSVRLDDLVALALPNGIAHHLWTFAIWKAGATPCVLSHRSTDAELAASLSLVRPGAFIGADRPAAADVRTFPADPPTRPAAGPPPPDLAAQHWKAVGSGGSTGRPKLIVDHAEARMTGKIRGLIDLFALPEGGVVMSPGPLQHNAGFLFSNVSLLAGSRVIGLERFDAAECLAAIERHEVQWLFLVPAMMHRIWSLPPAVREAFDLSSLRRVVHMAAPCPGWLKQAWIDWLGPDRVVEGYAGTEVPGTVITGREWLARRGSVGRVQPGGITVRDARGEPCPPGVVGEIFFPAADVARFHYIGAEPRTDGEGRISLGDLGHLDGEGYLFLADRRTDLMIRGGANVYPAEVEGVLEEHPAVATAIAIGLPCEELGQRVHAVLEPIAGAIIEVDAIDAFARDRLTSYKCPETYEVVAGPLRDEAGKARRGALRDERVGWLETGERRFLTRAIRHG